MNKKNVNESASTESSPKRAENRYGLKSLFIAFDRILKTRSKSHSFIKLFDTPQSYYIPRFATQTSDTILSLHDPFSGYLKTVKAERILSAESSIGQAAVHLDYLPFATTRNTNCVVGVLGQSELRKDDSFYGMYRDGLLQILIDHTLLMNESLGLTKNFFIKMIEFNGLDYFDILCEDEKTLLDKKTALKMAQKLPIDTVDLASEWIDHGLMKIGRYSEREERFYIEKGACLIFQFIVETVYDDKTESCSLTFVDFPDIDHIVNNKEGVIYRSFQGDIPEDHPVFSTIFNPSSYKAFMFNICTSCVYARQTIKLLHVEGFLGSLSNWEYAFEEEPESLKEEIQSYRNKISQQIKNLCGLYPAIKKEVENFATREERKKTAEILDSVQIKNLSPKLEIAEKITATKNDWEETSRNSDNIKKISYAKFCASEEEYQATSKYVNEYRNKSSHLEYLKNEMKQIYGNLSQLSVIAKKYAKAYKIKLGLPPIQQLKI